MTMLFKNSVIDKFNKEMFDTLLYSYNLNNSTPKRIDFDEESEDINKLDGGFTRGFYFTKKNIKYVLDKEDEDGNQNLDKLPIRVKSYYNLDTTSKDVIKYIADDFKSFRIKPELKYSIKLITQLDGIIHEDNETWTMIKILTFTEYCRRINTILSGIRHCGKTSYPTSLGLITNKGTVIDKPGSNAGLAKGITEDGYLKLDEIGDLQPPEKRALYSFLFQAGGMNSHWRTGKAGSKAHNLLAKYDIPNLSVGILCNLYEDYLCEDGVINIKNKDAFIQYMFKNGQAINRRFFPMRINPVDTPLKENEREELGYYLPADQFKSNGDVYDSKIRQAYISIMKSMEYYKVNWDKLVDYDYVDKSMNSYKVKATHLLSYREILCGIYIYAKCDALTFHKTYNRYKNVLDTWNKQYYAALDYYNKITDDDAFEKPEEVDLSGYS